MKSGTIQVPSKSAALGFLYLEFWKKKPSHLNTAYHTHAHNTECQSVNFNCNMFCCIVPGLNKCLLKTSQIFISFLVIAYEILVELKKQK